MVWECVIDVRGLTALPEGSRLSHLWTLPADCLLVEMSNGGLYAPGVCIMFVCVCLFVCLFLFSSPALTGRPMKRRQPSRGTERERFPECWDPSIAAPQKNLEQRAEYVRVCMCVFRTLQDFRASDELIRVPW